VSDWRRPERAWQPQPRRGPGSAQIWSSAPKRRREMSCLLNFNSVADPDPGSGAFLTRDPDPGSGIGFFPDLGSRIPTPYFLELSDKFLGKKFYNSLKTGPNFDNKFFFTPLFCSWFWIRDLRSGMGKNQDPGSGLKSRIRHTEF
jgi:hypothetical protein